MNWFKRIFSRPDPFKTTTTAKDTNEISYEKSVSEYLGKGYSGLDMKKSDFSMTKFIDTFFTHSDGDKIYIANTALFLDNSVLTGMYVPTIFIILPKYHTEIRLIRYKSYWELDLHNYGFLYTSYINQDQIMELIFYIEDIAGMSVYDMFSIKDNL